MLIFGGAIVQEVSSGILMSKCDLRWTNWYRGRFVQALQFSLIIPPMFYIVYRLWLAQQGPSRLQ
jgi:hypothetical protein